MGLLNEVLDKLITEAKRNRVEADLEDLQNKNYEKVKDKSMLRFLVDLRGEDTSNKQLRDDLMTMLIAGHETTAALLTWALFELAQAPEIVAKAQEEVDRVIGDRRPSMDDVKNMPYVRLILAESLRKYPEPPLLIRRALRDDVLPEGAAGFRPKIQRGTDLFLSLYNIHNSPEFYENPEKFDPERFTRPFKNDQVKGWDGFDPEKMAGQLYPNEIASDFAYLPFGGGQRKCVGDQFATLEAAVTLAMLLRRFEFDLTVRPDEVGFFTGATIHTRNGLPMKVRRRATEGKQASEEQHQTAAAL